MAATQIQITLPEDTLRKMQDDVSSGLYRSISDIVLEGYLRLQEPDPELKPWSPEQVARLIQEDEEHPEERRTIAQMRQALAEQIAALRQQQ